MDGSFWLKMFRASTRVSLLSVGGTHLRVLFQCVWTVGLDGVVKFGNVISI